MASEYDAASDVLLRIDPPNGNRLMIQSSNGGVDQYDFSVRACRSPTCGCYSVDLLCTPLGESKDIDREPRIVALDILEQIPQEPFHNKEQIDIPLTRVVAAGLSSEHWRRLRAWLTNEKRQAMEDMDLDSLTTGFPPAVTTDGELLGYDEIFPFAEPLTFSVDEQPWVADDLYCVQPKCDCIETLLCFLPLSGADGIDNDEQHNPIRQPVSVTATVCYDIRQRTWEVVDDPPVSRATARTLMTALEEERPDFHEVVTERRRQLRYLYPRRIKRHAAPHSRPFVAPTKIGRNQPCPCGSGKKYKRCCGR
jgi:hypothetical protein